MMDCIFCQFAYLLPYNANTTTTIAATTDTAAAQLSMIPLLYRQYRREEEGGEKKDTTYDLSFFPLQLSYSSLSNYYFRLSTFLSALRRHNTTEQ